MLTDSTGLRVVCDPGDPPDVASPSLHEDYLGELLGAALGVLQARVNWLADGRAGGASARALDAALEAMQVTIDEFAGWPGQRCWLADDVGQDSDPVSGD